MDFDNGLPIYIQILNLLKIKMATGDIKEGDKLPSVRDMATELKVNPNTISRSYTELEKEDLIYTQRGMGTFVTEDIEKLKALKKKMATKKIHKFILEMKELGFTKEELSRDILELKMEED
jgi:DNA-binding transcriptional regulator YhcF (GntR family)